ncbi:MAG TPA: hypothetical protein VFQ82_02040 [Stellaceae bacterium]|jgi:hypothetical protein|nr:hypothetical protein [Stellaceae bacterium]
MTLLEIEELTRYWAKHPPPHIAVSAWLGLHRSGNRKPPFGGPASQTQNAEPGSLLAELGPGFGAGDVHAGLASVVLDFATLRRKGSP